MVFAKSTRPRLRSEPAPAIAAGCTAMDLYGEIDESCIIRCKACDGEMILCVFPVLRIGNPNAATISQMMNKLITHVGRDLHSPTTEELNRMRDIEDCLIAYIDPRR